MARQKNEKYSKRTAKEQQKATLASSAGFTATRQRLSSRRRLRVMPPLRLRRKALDFLLLRIRVGELLESKN